MECHPRANGDLHKIYVILADAGIYMSVIEIPTFVGMTMRMGMTGILPSSRTRGSSMPAIEIPTFVGMTRRVGNDRWSVMPV